MFLNGTQVHLYCTACAEINGCMSGQSIWFSMCRLRHLYMITACAETNGCMCRHDHCIRRSLHVHAMSVYSHQDTPMYMQTLVLKHTARHTCDRYRKSCYSPHTSDVQYAYVRYSLSIINSWPNQGRIQRRGHATRPILRIIRLRIELFLELPTERPRVIFDRTR